MRKTQRRPYGEGSIRRIRGREDAWEVRVCTGKDENTGKYKYVSKTVRGGESEAKAELRKILCEIDTNEFVEPNRMTVAQYLAYWLEMMKAGGRSPKTIERYEEECRRHIIPALGDKQLQKLKPYDIQKYYARVMKEGRLNGPGGLSALTALHHHTLLHKALGDAVRWEMISKNPVDGVERPRAKPKEPRVLEKDEMFRLLDAAKGTTYYLPVLMLLATGMRRGELLALRWSDINLDRGLVWITRSMVQTSEGVRPKETKTERSRREVGVPSAVAQALKAHKEEQDVIKAKLGEGYVDQDLIFAKVDGSPVKPDSLSNNFFRVANRARIPDLTLHSLRHSHATFLIADGEHVTEVSKRLGHSDIRTTLGIYTHTINQMQAGMADRLEQMFHRDDESQSQSPPSDEAPPE